MDFPYHWKYHLLKERTGTASGEPLDSLQCINFKQIEIVFMCNSIIIILTTINHESLAIWRNSCIWLHHTFVKHVSPYEFLTLNFVLPTVCFQMCPQIACLRRSIVALVAFVWFFSTVPFQMYPQSACLWGCIVTLVAFVWLNVIVGLFLQDFLNLQTKVIMFKSLFHYVVFCPNGSFKLIQINYFLLVNNHKY